MSLSSVTTPPNPNSPAVPVASGHLSSRFLRLSSRGGSVSKLRLLRNSAARILSRTRMTCWPRFVHHLLHKCCVLHVWFSWIYSFVFSFSCMYLSFIYCSLFDKYKINLPLMEKLPLMFSCWKNMMKPEVCVCVYTRLDLFSALKEHSSSYFFVTFGNENRMSQNLTGPPPHLSYN